MCIAQGVYLVGHSRGGKLSVLAAARDPRITACCLLDPVDNTKYAPLGPEFPSAVAALHQLSMQVCGPTCDLQQTSLASCTFAMSAQTRWGSIAASSSVRRSVTRASVVGVAWQSCFPDARFEQTVPVRARVPTVRQSPSPWSVPAAEAIVRRAMPTMRTSTRPAPHRHTRCARLAVYHLSTHIWHIREQQCPRPSYQLLPHVQVVVRDAGHFQFLDAQSAIDRAICTVGKTPDTVVRILSQVCHWHALSSADHTRVENALYGCVLKLYASPQASMIAWAQIMVRGSLAAVPAEAAMQAASGAMREFEAALQRALPNVPSMKAEQAIFESRIKGLTQATGSV